MCPTAAALNFEALASKQSDLIDIIQKTGYIEVFVENSSGKTVTASGTYTK